MVNSIETETVFSLEHGNVKPFHKNVHCTFWSIFLKNSSISLKNALLTPTPNLYTLIQQYINTMLKSVKMTLSQFKWNTPCMFCNDLFILNLHQFVTVFSYIGKKASCISSEQYSYS